jgi:hypothetical protein
MSSGTITRKCSTGEPYAGLMLFAQALIGLMLFAQALIGLMLFAQALIAA